MTRSCPPQCGHTVISTPNTRRSRSAQVSGAFGGRASNTSPQPQLAARVSVRRFQDLLVLELRGLLREVLGDRLLPMMHVPVEPPDAIEELRPAWSSVVRALAVSTARSLSPMRGSPVGTVDPPSM
jgi:hypothetical protein